MANLEVNNLIKRYGSGAAAINDVSFHVSEGEFVTLLGPSGCGKSTTLAAIAGLDHPDSGSISIGNKAFFDRSNNIALPPEARNCGLVFQAYALWPHMRVRENVEFPLRLRKVPPDERKRLVEETLDLVEMKTFSERYPHELSGGQQQRVALARTLVYRPDVLLLDEPLSNLDSKLRERARVWLSQLHKRLKQTMVYVTHDQTEALALSDRIIIMNSGSIVQVGTPHQIYNNPVNAFVADFIGTTAILSGTLADVDDELVHVKLMDGQILIATGSNLPAVGSNVNIAIRPERLKLLDGKEGPDNDNSTLITAEVTARSFLGARFQYDLDVCGEILKVESLEQFDAPRVSIRIPAKACITFRA